MNCGHKNIYVVLGEIISEYKKGNVYLLVSQINAFINVKIEIQYQ